MEMLEFNPTAIIVSSIMYVICMLILWNSMVGSYGMKQKIAISIIALPVLYFAVLYQVER